MSSAAGSGTPKWPGDHAEKHRQAALLGWARKRGFTRDTVKRGRRKNPTKAERNAASDRAIDNALRAIGQSPDQFLLHRRAMRDELTRLEAMHRRKGGDRIPGLLSRIQQVRYLGKAMAENRDRNWQVYAQRFDELPPFEPPSRGMELARQVQVSAQRTRPYAHSDYSPHAGNVARLTLMHELGMEQDAAKRAKIRRELRKLGVPSDQIPKEPRKPAARISVRAHVYHGQPGFLISGKDALGRGVSIFARSKAEAERIRQQVKAGERVTFDNEPRTERSAAVKSAFKEPRKGYEKWKAEREAIVKRLPIDREQAMVHLIAHGHAHPAYMRRYAQEQRVTFDQEPRTERSAAVSQPKAARKRGGGAS